MMSDRTTIRNVHTYLSIYNQQFICTSVQASLRFNLRRAYITMEEGLLIIQDGQQWSGVEKRSGLDMHRRRLVIGSMAGSTCACRDFSRDRRVIAAAAVGAIVECCRRV